MPARATPSRASIEVRGSKSSSIPLNIRLSKWHQNAGNGVAVVFRQRGRGRDLATSKDQRIWILINPSTDSSRETWAARPHKPKIQGKNTDSPIQTADLTSSLKNPHIVVRNGLKAAKGPRNLKKGQV